MKIGFIEETSELGGAQYNNLLLQKYRPKAYQTIVFLPEKGRMFDELEKLEIEVVLYKRGKHIPFSFYLGHKKIINPFAIIWSLFELIYSVFSIKKVLKKEGVSLVVTNGMMAHLYGGLAARLMKVNVLWRLEDIVSKTHAFGIGYKFFNFFSSKIPDSVIVPSNSVRKLNFGDDYKDSGFVSVIYNSAELDEFNVSISKVLRSELEIGNEITVIGISSRLTPWKGHIQFINAAETALKKAENLLFVIIGGALFSSNKYEIELKELINSKGLSDKILMTGFRRDIASCMNSLDIIVLPSILPDPCPRVMFESMALQKPIIGSNLGGIPEVIEDGYNGIIVDPFDPDMMAEAMIKLSADKKLMNEMGKKGLFRLNNKYSLDNYVSSHYQLFKQLMKPHNQ